MKTTEYYKEWQKVLVFENETEYEYGIVLPNFDTNSRTNQYKVFIYTYEKPKVKLVYEYQICPKE